MCYVGIVIVVVRSRRRAVCEHVCCRSPNLANTPVTSRPLWVCGQHALYSSVFSLPPRKPHGVASLTHGLLGTWRDLRPEDRATAGHGLLCDSEHLAFAEDLRSPLLELGPRGEFFAPPGPEPPSRDVPAPPRPNGALARAALHKAPAKCSARASLPVTPA